MKHGRIAREITAAFVGASLLWSGQVLAMEDLRIPVAMTSTTTTLAEQTAIHKGFFKDIGYEARVYSVSGGENAAVLALERGQLPFLGSDDKIPLAIRPGSNIRVVGSEMNVLPYWLVAGKHVKSYEQSPRPVKVGISSPTSGNVYVSLKLLEAAGIQDTHLVKIGGSSAGLAGVKGSKIDVGPITFGRKLRAKKANLPLLGTANEQFVKEYAFLQLAMNKNYIKDQRDTAEAMFGTLIRGGAFVNDLKNREEVMHVLTKVMRNPADIAKKMYEIKAAGGSIRDRWQDTEPGIKSIPADVKLVWAPTTFL